MRRARGRTAGWAAAASWVGATAWAADPAVLGSAWIDPPVVDAAGVVQPDDRRLVAVRLADGGEAVDAVCVWQAGRCRFDRGPLADAALRVARADLPDLGVGVRVGGVEVGGDAGVVGPAALGAALLVHDLGRGGGWGPVDVEVVSEGGGWARSGPLRPASDTFPVRVDAAVADGWRCAMAARGVRAGPLLADPLGALAWVAEAERRCGVDARAVSRAVCVSVKGGEALSVACNRVTWPDQQRYGLVWRRRDLPGYPGNVGARAEDAVPECVGSVWVGPDGRMLAVRVWKCPQPYAGATEEALWTWRATRAARGEGDAPRYGATRIRFPAR